MTTSATKQPDDLTPEQVRAKLARLAVLAQKSDKGPSSAEAATAQMEALNIAIELGGALYCAFLRMARAQEHMAAIMESEFGPVAGSSLFRGQ